MRFDGLLTSWNDTTGSGILTPGKSGDDIGAAFPQDGIVPAVGEARSFEVELGPDGQKRAHRIGHPHPSSRTAARHAQAQAQSYSTVLTAALVILAASAALFYASLRHDGKQPMPEPEAAAIPHEHRTDLVAASRFARPAPAACDGRTRCVQMKSCEEAKFFSDNCPGAELDGDGDGLPCEAQWCTAGHASLQPPL